MLRNTQWAPPLGLSSFMTKKERLETAILTAVKASPGCTRNKLDGLAGKKNALAASKEEVRKAIQHLLDEGSLAERALTDAERKSCKFPRQVRSILTAPE